MSTNKYASKLASQRWHAYLKEQNQNNKRFTAKSKYFIALVLWVIKLILSIVEKIQIKRKRTVEKICVE
ncbi:MAG: hypothetical protein ACJ71K_04390 [Nitrososphaeraceae archaeon]